MWAGNIVHKYRYVCDDFASWNGLLVRSHDSIKYDQCPRILKVIWRHIYVNEKVSTKQIF